jgi:hypothetical protein
LLLFFSFFVLFVVLLNSGARQTMLHAVWTLSKLGRSLLAFLCRASHITHGKELCRALPFPKAHDKGLCRVKMHRAPFAVRLGKMRTAKAVPCVFWPLPCASAHESGSGSPLCGQVFC